MPSNRPKRYPRGGASLYAELGPGETKPHSSIPSKYETILFTGPREKTGWNTSALRFVAQADENPGPGAYDGGYGSVGPRAKSASSATSTVDFNKKGYGPMASSALRFRHRAGYTGPGPGEYGLMLKGVSANVGFNRAGSTGAFHPPLRPIDPTKCVDNGIPGPGPAPIITHTGEKILGNGPSHTSSFKATSHQLEMKNAAAPPPGTYELVDLWNGHHGAAASRTPSKAGLSSFAGRSVSSSLAQFSSPLMFLDPLRELGSQGKDSGPGPGQYEMQDHASIKKKMEEKRGSSAKPIFAPPEFTDRFGRPQDDRRSDLSLAPLASGEETSRTPARLNGPAPGISAPFVSKSPGRDQWDIKEATKAPGPAFYSPIDSSKKISHHVNSINSRKRYV